MKRYDAIILGAGIAGLSAAIAFKRRGKSVLVFSKPNPGEASLAAAGILDPLLEMEEHSPILPLALNCFDYYPKFLKLLKKETGQQTSYKKTGMLLVASSAREEVGLKDRYRWHKNTGVSVKLLKKEAAQRYSSALTPKLRSAIYYPTVGRVQPKRFIAVVRKAAQKMGVEFITSKQPWSCQTKSQRVQGIKIGNRVFEAKYVVNAMGGWIGKESKAGLKVPVAPIRGQMMIVKGKQLSDVILHSSEGYYSVPWNAGEYLLGSTVEDVGFRPGVTEVGLRSIRSGLKQMVPEIEKFKTLRTWAGLRPRSKDCLPLIGSTRVKGLFVLTGFFRSGILLGPCCGELLVKGILEGKFDNLLKPFQPTRFKGC